MQDKLSKGIHTMSHGYHKKKKRDSPKIADPTAHDSLATTVCQEHTHREKEQSVSKVKDIYSPRESRVAV